MAKPDKLLTATHPERGTLFAAIDPAVRFVAGEVRDRRFSAFLAPFPDEASARMALKSAGAKLVEATR